MQRLSRLPGRTAWLTGVVLGLYVLGTVSAPGATPWAEPIGLLLLAANVAPLLWVDRAPLGALVIFALAYPAWVALGYPPHLLQSIPTAVAMVAVGAGPWPWWRRALGLLPAVEVLATGAAGVWDADVTELGFVAVVFVIVWGLGAALGELHRRTVALEEAREALARAAVAHERERIARDLHDMVGHAMSVITVQAGVAGHLLPAGADQARQALGAIERTGRDILTEMRAMLDGLRGGDEGTAPGPGLDDLEGLVEGVREAGVVVRLSVRGAARPLPVGLSRSAYRIAQEALTNTVRHAPGATADLRLTFAPGGLELVVCDRGGGPDPAPSAYGLGLRGMRERAALHGGQVDAASTEDGFHVRAWLPEASP